MIEGQRDRLPAPHPFPKGEDHRERDLLLIDSGQEFTALLAARFPAARVIAMDATLLKERALYDGAPVGAVVSGIPLLNLSLGQIDAIIDGAFWYLRPEGAFYQFTYRPRCPVPSE